MPANLTEFRDSSGVDVSDKFVSMSELSDLHNAGYMTNDGDSFYGVQLDTLWAWGRNGYRGGGQLGLSDITDRSSPTQVGTLANWKQTSAGGYHSIAVKKDGTLWAWGGNAYYKLGLGDNIHRSSPVQVGTLTNWKQVSVSKPNSLAVKTDGTLWAWGNNNSGQLGLGDRTEISSPVQVGSLTDWSLVSAASYHTLAIKTDGTLWAWGRNAGGQLGLGDRTYYSSPVQVGSLNNWKTLVFSSEWQSSSAIKTDGTLWVWGENADGQLGLGDITDRSSPVQVGALTNWKQISYGNSSTAAVKTDGTLWTWGRNGYGQLGLNNRTAYSSPVQVGSLTDWSSVAVSDHLVVLAIKTDGTLWSWGKNYYGLFGDGNPTGQRSSPVQVGSLTNWKQISVGTDHCLAIK